MSESPKQANPVRMNRASRRLILSMNIGSKKNKDKQYHLTDKEQIAYALKHVHDNKD